MNNDARSKLRSMGGIMASSPELMQVAQKFQVGAPVMGMPPAAPMGPNFNPRMAPPPMPGIRPTAPQVPPLAGTIPVVPREMLGDARRRALAGTAPSFGMGMGAGLGSLNPILEDDISVDDLLEGAIAPMAQDTGEGWVMPGGTATGKTPQWLQDAVGESLRKTEIAGYEGPSSEETTSRVPMGGPRRGGLNKKLSAEETTSRVPMGGPRRGGLNKKLSAEETVMAQPLVPTKLDQSVIDKMLDLSRSDPNIPFGTETPPPGGGDDKPTKRDLRSRYNEKLELFKEIYGTDDKDEAQDRAMSLAMIGLAIAAGQSPNALTNIAQGAMVGLQGMGARREAARDRERGMRTLALEAAIGQQEAEAGAEAEAAKMEQEQANRIELEREKARLTGPGGSGGGGGAFKYEPPPLVAETFYKTKGDLAAAAREDPSIVPEQYGDNVDGWADLQARRSSKDYLRTLLPQIPEADRESAMLSGQQLLYPDPSGTGLRIVQNPSDLDFILPDQEFVFLDRSADPPTYVRQRKVVDPEAGRFKVITVE